MSDQNAEVLSVKPAPLAVYDPNLIPSEALAVFGGSDRPVWFSFDPTTRAGILTMDKCETQADHTIKSWANKPINIRDIFAHKVDIETETGEIVTCTRSVLIDTDGKTFACTSAGVAKSILRLIRQHRMPPWQKGVRVIVSLRDLKPGRQWLELLNDPEATEPARVRRPTA